MPAETILVLGGTADAVSLAHRIAEERPAERLIVSLAGRTRQPAIPAGELRIGGFGGAGGLAAFIGTEGVTRLVDATHPFAAGISRNAAKAAHTTAVRRIALVRPAWFQTARDTWTAVACLAAARDALPAKSRPLLALGRQHLAPFASRLDLAPVLRMVDPPDDGLPFPAELVIGRPSGDWREEEALLRRLGVTHIVCRNSGGQISYAKIEAARHLGLPVIMIDRPPAPPPPLAATIEDVIDWLAA